MLVPHNNKIKPERHIFCDLQNVEGLSPNGAMPWKRCKDDACKSNPYITFRFAARVLHTFIMPEERERERERERGEERTIVGKCTLVNGCIYVNHNVVVATTSSNHAACLFCACSKCQCPYAQLLYMETSRSFSSL